MEVILLRQASAYVSFLNRSHHFIVELEVRDSEYPIEIFNEIRSTFTHLSRYKIQNSTQDLLSAERHIKRGILDCFKYMCISYAEEVNSFRSKYRKVDLSIADNGNFLLELDNLENEARKSYISAKRAEIKSEISEKALYELFETAYNKYYDLSKFLSDSQEAILFASNHSKRINLITIVSIIVTIVSIIVAIVL